ncbi:MAG: DUF1059 domain-containing protein [Chloroflexi bacterium]|nr:DUF1059 domain-containing protein [Chloroflexota bacterium]
MSEDYSCSDIGLDCDWRASSETEGELLRLIGAHFVQVHQITDTPADLVLRVREAIKSKTSKTGSCRGGPS